MFNKNSPTVKSERIIDFVLKTEIHYMYFNSLCLDYMRIGDENEEL